MARVFILAPLLIFAGLAGVLFVGLYRADPDDLPSALIGRMAPTVPAEAVAGTQPVTDISAGEVTIVNVWASWCPPCRAEHPNLLALKAEGLRIVGINLRDDPEAAAQYLRDDGNPFAATVVDASGRVALDWGVSAPPESFILSADGTVRHRYIGPLVGSQYEQQFLPVLREALNGEN